MFKTASGLFIDIWFNNFNAPLTLDNVESLLIVNNIYDKLPTIRMTLIDDKNIFANKLQLTDGLKISVYIGNFLDNGSNKRDEQDLMYSLMFDMVSAPEVKIETSAKKITIYGVLNFLAYWKDSKPFHYTGTSNEIFKLIAKELDLKYHGVKTNDYMTWHNFSKSKAEFVSDVTDRAYIKDGSCMLSYITIDGGFHLIDVNSEKNPDYILIPIGADDPKNKVYRYSNINYNYNSALNNLTYGYKNTSYQYSFARSDYYTKDTKALNKYADKENSTIKLDYNYSDYYNLNRYDYDLIDQVNSEVDSINVGNVHPNWNKAYYQNKRYKSLFNVYCEVYIDNITPINVGDKIQVAFESINDLTDKSLYDFKYWIVESKTIGLSMKRYTEKLLLSTTGFLKDYWQNLSPKDKESRPENA